MEGITRLVAEHLARNGFDRPLDYRRLHWSRWFRCESPHSLLFVPSRPGVFALAEEVMEFPGRAHVGTAALGCPAEQSSAAAATQIPPAAPSRMLAVLQFCEDDDMAFVLDRMFSRENPMRARLASGRCFVRFVVIEDEAQRRSISSALNHWLISSSEKPSAIGAHFATSLELTPATDDGMGRTLLSLDKRTDDKRTAGGAAGDSPAHASSTERSAQAAPAELSPDREHTQISDTHLDSGAAQNIHCPSPLPSGF